MNKPLYRLIALGLLVLSSVEILSTPSTAQSIEANTNEQLLHGEVSAIDSLPSELQDRLGFKCTPLNSQQARVDEVLAGSKAALAGLHVGDVLLKASVTSSGVTLELIRGRRILTAQINHTQQLPLAAPQLESATTDKHPDIFSIDISKFGAALEQQSTPNTPLDANLKLLASYDIELIIDQSDSMKTRDCPGGLSRWNWVGQQSEALASALTPYVPDSLTITTFAAHHNVYKHSNPQIIVSIFSNPHFELGTRLGEALQDRLNDYFQHHQPNDKPHLIVVITDGVPFPVYERPLVRNELVNATRYMNNSHELVISFLQVGGRDRLGRSYLGDLDANLVNYGARYDFVHTKLFDRVGQIGIAQALVEAIQESTSAIKPKLDFTPWDSIDDMYNQFQKRRMYWRF